MKECGGKGEAGVLWLMLMDVLSFNTVLEASCEGWLLSTTC